MAVPKPPAPAPLPPLPDVGGHVPVQEAPELTLAEVAVPVTVQPEFGELALPSAVPAR